MTRLAGATTVLTLLELRLVIEATQEKLDTLNHRRELLTPAECHCQLMRARALRLLRTAYEDFKEGCAPDREGASDWVIPPELEEGV